VIRNESWNLRIFLPLGSFRNFFASRSFFKKEWARGPWVRKHCSK
jgi:hypothetical protein